MRSLKNLMAGALLASVSLSFATVYTDTVGDVAVPGAPFPHIDITGAVVTNTATDITFEIDLNGSPVATNWGKYNIIMRTAATGLDAAGNGWGRPYSLSGGANKFIGGWADQATLNSQQYTYSAGAWSMDASSPFTSTITATSMIYTVTLASLGLSVGQTFTFDMVTSGGGGGDGAVDALSNPNANITNWGDASVVNGVSYTVQGTPEPATMAALGLGVIAMIRRRRK